MNIAMINCGLVGSTGKIMHQIADLASEKGHKVCLVVSALPVNKTIKTKHPLFIIGNEHARKLNVLLGRVTGFTNCFGYFSTLKMLKQLDSFKPDLIHLHNLHESFINLPLLFKYIKKKNIKVVWTLHDCWAFTGHCAKFPDIECDKWQTGCKKCPQLKGYPKTYFLDNSKFMFKIKKDLFTNVDDMVIVTPSKWLSGLVEKSFLNNYKIKVINNGIDLSMFKPTASDFRKKYNIPENKFIVLGVKFAWSKINGLDIFIELSKKLDDKYQIVLVGTDKEVDAILPENIISISRTKNQTKLAEIYTAADLFINPARDDNYPTVNMEALACGTPVITSDVGGCPETIFSNCGKVVPANSDLLAKEIKEIANNKNFSQEECLKESTKNDMFINFNKYIDLFESMM